jgi:hypothetical protein
MAAAAERQWQSNGNRVAEAAVGSVAAAAAAAAAAAVDANPMLSSH